jgi:hypothetical protein
LLFDGSNILLKRLLLILNRDLKLGHIVQWKMTMIQSSVEIDGYGSFLQTARLHHLSPSQTHISPPELLDTRRVPTHVRPPAGSLGNLACLHISDKHPIGTLPRLRTRESEQRVIGLGSSCLTQDKRKASRISTFLSAEMYACSDEGIRAKAARAPQSC